MFCYNLINNAIKYSDFNGKIDINLTSNDKEVTFKIKDYGCGISKNYLPYIFDKFYQVNKSHASKSNGLGLALAKLFKPLNHFSQEVIFYLLTDLLFTFILW